MDPWVGSWRAACGRWVRLLNERHPRPFQCGGPDPDRTFDSRWPTTADMIGMAGKVHRAVPRAEIPAHDIPSAPASSRQERDHGTGPFHRTVHGDLHVGFPSPRNAGGGCSTCLLTLH